MDKDEYRLANTIANGYFYSFDYSPNVMRIGYDRNPFVFVVGPSTKSLRNFVGINLHHLPVIQREHFVRNMQKTYSFMDRGRTVLTLEACEHMLPGISIAKREYNREYVSRCILVKPERVPLYVATSGHLLQQQPDYMEYKWLEERGLYVVKENKARALS